MKRKDCEFDQAAQTRRDIRRPAHPARVTLLTAAIATAAVASQSPAGTLRLWPQAVVVENDIRLDAVAELRGFEPDTERDLARIPVTEAPPAGGSRIIHLNLVRTALETAGANLARITFSGSTECAVTRPAEPEPVSRRATSEAPPESDRSAGRTAPNKANAANAQRAHDTTLKRAVFAHFDRELARFAGRAEITFDHTAEQVLELSGPEYSFNVRRRSSSVLGLVPLEVDVLREGRVVQTVPLVVQVSMVREVVTAARAINQEATIQPSDVQVLPLTFTRTDKLGIDDPAHVIGQRAKRFIAAGSLIEPNLLEQVPLVMRGQLVTLISQVGPVRVVTSGKAADTGTLGDVVKVRGTDTSRVEFDGVVVGPGKVRVGPPTATLEALGAEASASATGRHHP